ncbi:MAG: hypothetical protein FWB96_01245 [Defluviitaleaceae bacterium]|nr:hypothetical protein [Defluviitaleaceae bacterium]MCL2261682.1 hypothetical protein [Defluviitaleaceae bacterium]
MTHIVINSYTRLIVGNGAVNYNAGDKISPSPAEIAAFGDSFHRIASYEPPENDTPDSETDEGDESDTPPTSAQVRSMNKGSLDALAEKMGVDISGAKNNNERAELIIVAIEAPPKAVEGEGVEDEANSDTNNENDTPDSETDEGGESDTPPPTDESNDT